MATNIGNLAVTITANNKVKAGVNAAVADIEQGAARLKNKMARQGGISNLATTKNLLGSGGMFGTIARGGLAATGIGAAGMLLGHLGGGIAGLAGRVDPNKNILDQLLDAIPSQANNRAAAAREAEAAADAKKEARLARIAAQYERINQLTASAARSAELHAAQIGLSAEAARRVELRMQGVANADARRIAAREELNRFEQGIVDSIKQQQELLRELENIPLTLGMGANEARAFALTRGGEQVPGLMEAARRADQMVAAANKIDQAMMGPRRLIEGSAAAHQASIDLKRQQEKDKLAPIAEKQLAEATQTNVLLRDVARELNARVELILQTNGD